MKFAVITSSFPATADDFSGIFVHRLNEQLVARGIDLCCLTWQTDRAATFTPKSYPLKRVAYAPPTLQTLFGGDGAPENLTQRPLTRLLATPAIAAMLKQAIVVGRDADLIVGHWAVPGGLIARVVGRLLNKPSFIVGHSGGVRMLSRSVGGRVIMEQLALGPTSFPNTALAERWNALCLPMGFDGQDTLSDGTHDVLCLGRLVPIKGIDIAIRALAETSLTLHVAGDGFLRSQLESLADSLGTQVVWHGRVHGESKRALLTSCRVFALPSRTIHGRQEGMPIALLEAMSAGLSPVTARFEGVEDVTDRSLGTFDPKTWRAALVGAHANWNREDAVRTRSRVEPFRWEQLGARWADVLSTAARRQF